MSNVLQAVPTSGDVHLYDTIFYLPINNSAQRNSSHLDLNNAPSSPVNRYFYFYLLSFYFPLTAELRHNRASVHLRILDVEGFDGAQKKLPLDLEIQLQSKEIELQERDKFAERRWERVQEFPRLCYVLSDVIMYPTALSTYDYY